MTITVLAAVGANLVIGRDGDMPWHLPEDLAHFKAVTMGHTMVMGRKTYDSIGRALPGRRTIVITRQRGWHAPSVEVAHSLPEALALAGPADVFVIGGSEDQGLCVRSAQGLQGSTPKRLELLDRRELSNVPGQ